MDRKELYALIKKYNLGDEVKKRFNDNYTRVSSDNLKKVIYDYDCTLVEPVSCKDEPKKADISVNTVENPFEAACLLFLSILKDNEVLDDLLAKLQ